VIPHTWSATTLAHRRVGDAVNLEADLLAKYTERLLQGSGLPSGMDHQAPLGAAISGEWLTQHGWG